MSRERRLERHGPDLSHRLSPVLEWPYYSSYTDDILRRDASITFLEGYVRRVAHISARPHEA